MIRDDVNHWMEDDEFGVAGVPDPPLEPPEDGPVDTEMPLAPCADTHDYVEDLLTSNIDDVETFDAEEAIPADPVAEAILRDATINAAREEMEPDSESEEAFATETSDTVEASVLGDNTEEICHVPSELELSDFQNALGLWVNLHSISRSAYSQLVEVLRLVKDIDDIKTLTRRKDTLKALVRKSLPLSKLRQSTVKLDMSRLPTRSKTTEKVLSIDLEDTLSTLLSSSQIFDQVYKGMAHHTNCQVQNPWEAPWWGESVRTSSGKFHRYPNGEPIFPSDFIIWRCRPGLTDHVPDKCPNGCKRTHIGRITWTGLDVVRSSQDADESPSGRPLLMVQRVYQPTSYVPPHLATLTTMMGRSRITHEARELVLVEDSIIHLHPKRVVRRLSNVLLDYQYSSKDHESHQQPCTAPYIVRYVWNESDMQVREIRYSSPHRAELELRTFGRKYIVDNFTTREMISLPLHMFVDAFGLYRNMYRSIEGLYYIPQFFDIRIRNRRSSVITATLGPYGAQRADVFKALAHSSRLDRGTELIVNGKPIFVCSFVAAIIGDMPSQQELSGCLGPTANRPCRYCLAASDEKSDVNFDIRNLGKYHDQIIRDRARIISRVHAPSTRKIKLAGLGLHDNETLFSTLQGLFPALDVIRSRPIDAAHSEYAGLSKYVHRLIFQEATSLLTATSVEQAAGIFHYFPTPPGWPRFQSPRTHLDSYSMQEYARGIVVLPIFLRCWLQDHHIKPEIHKFLKSRARDYLVDQDLTSAIGRMSANDLVVTAVWTISCSVLATCSRSKTGVVLEDPIASRYDILHKRVIAGRKAFQYLCQVQSDASRSKVPGRLPVSANAPLQSEASFSQPSVVQTAGSIRRRRVDPTERTNLFLRWKQLPNVHTGMHLAEVAREYGSCTMVLTLAGEDMHKLYKDEIYSTNHINAASTLINMNNHSKTVSHLIAGCYKEKYPRLHAAYQTIRKQCPRMSQALDPHLGRLEDEDDLGASPLDITSDPHHKRPRTFLRIPRNRIHANDDALLKVSTSADIRNNPEFLAMLRKSSFEHYDAYMIDPGPRPIQWWQKMTFTTS
ncbi:hypothetical protein GGR50DRAFT_690442 [Xylaria sp. CBS 124048]|nr:hypothetical protein GGR50DRAFT_690442 [Xylaria sp. CBS 124048]